MVTGGDDRLHQPRDRFLHRSSPFLLSAGDYSSHPPVGITWAPEPDTMTVAHQR
jgi:hypothetical protein